MKLKKILYDLQDITDQETSICLANDDDYSVFDFLKMISDLDETEKELLLKKIACKCTDAELAEDFNTPKFIIKSKYNEILSKLQDRFPEK